MKQIGPDPDSCTYTILFHACSEYSTSREEILKMANTLYKDIQDRSVEIHVLAYASMMKAFVKGNDIKRAVDIAVFILDEYGDKDENGIVFNLLHFLHNDKQRGFFHSISVSVFYHVYSCLFKRDRVNLIESI